MSKKALLSFCGLYLGLYDVSLEIAWKVVSDGIEIEA